MGSEKSVQKYMNFHILKKKFQKKIILGSEIWAQNFWPGQKVALELPSTFYVYRRDRNNIGFRNYSDSRRSPTSVILFQIN